MKFKSYFHRRDAKSAEDNAFMFAVERTANIKVKPPYTEKILSALLSEFKMAISCPKGIDF